MINNLKQAVDMEFLKSIIDEDKEFEKELFQIFVENAKRNIAKMEEAMKLGDNNSWYMAAHAFKGASASIGAFDLSKILEYAQKHPEEDVNQKTDLLKKVNDEFSLVVSFINSRVEGL